MPIITSSETTLKGFSNGVGQFSLNDQLESNLASFFQWALLQAGGYFNVRLSASGAYGGSLSTLQPTHDPNFADGRIYQGFRSDWIWESGVQALNNAPLPIQISGVWINNSLYSPNSSGAYSHHYNYPLGRVVFDNPLPSNTLVQLEYSYRLFNFSTADVPWYRDILFRSFRADDSQFSQSASGQWAVNSENRLQLPAVIVEIAPSRYSAGIQLGGGQRVTQDVYFHIFTETHWDRKQLIDILIYQKEKQIWGFDKNLVAKANAFPLDYDGMLVPNAKMYPDLIQPTGGVPNPGYQWTRMLFKEAFLQPSQSNPPLFTSTVRYSVEVDLYEI